ncbi:alanine racemase, partial [candidate division KSB1 bacterium]
MHKINRRKFFQSAAALPAGAYLAGKLNLISESSQAAYNSPADVRLEIDLKNIDYNINTISKWVKDRPVMAVIKANAYGHGVVEVGKYLDKKGIHSLAVGKLAEALELRKAEVKCPVLNFGPYSKKDAEIIARENISQSVYNDNILYLNEAAKKLNRQAKVHIKIDTGLGRVGIPYHAAFEFVEKVSKLSNIKIEGIFTTLTEDEEFDSVQIERLIKICGDSEKNGINVGLKHAASSAGVLSYPDAHLDLVRPGITIYGHYPSDKEYDLKRIDLKPAMSLKTTVSCVKKLRKGDAVSYHRAFVAEKEEWVTTGAIGYSDAFPVNAPGNAHALINGKKYPLVALVTSNHISVKLGDDDSVKVG